MGLAKGVTLSILSMVVGEIVTPLCKGSSLPELDFLGIILQMTHFCCPKLIWRAEKDMDFGGCFHNFPTFDTFVWKFSENESPSSYKNVILVAVLLVTGVGGNS